MLPLLLLEWDKTSRTELEYVPSNSMIFSYLFLLVPPQSAPRDNS